MSSILLESLDKKRRLVFKKLKAFPEATLAGGTALSLQVAHRHSFDFDLFLERPIEKKDLLGLKKTFEVKQVLASP